MKPWRRGQWVIPPKQNSAFLAQMELVLNVYKRPYEAAKPAACMDESSRQLIRETRLLLTAGSIVPERLDYEYGRCGVANMFMDVELLVGKHLVETTERRIKKG